MGGCKGKGGYREREGYRGWEDVWEDVRVRDGEE